MTPVALLSTPSFPTAANRAPRALAGLLLALAAGTAAADEPAWLPDGLQATLGAAVIDHPSFIGSDRRETRVLPVVALDYGRFFLGPVPAAASALGLGVDLWRRDGLRLGVALTTDLSSPRKASDDIRLQGLGDVHGTQRFALFGTWESERFELRAQLARDIAGHDLGTVATLEAQARFRLGERLGLAIGPGVTWQSGQALQTQFGIDAAQAAASGRAVYRPRAGVSQWQLGAAATYGLDAHWSLGANAAYVRYVDDAADSPLTFKDTQNVFAIFAAYRF